MTKEGSNAVLCLDFKAKAKISKPYGPIGVPFSKNEWMSLNLNYTKHMHTNPKSTVDPCSVFVVCAQSEKHLVAFHGLQCRWK